MKTRYLIYVVVFMLGCRPAGTDLDLEEEIEQLVGLREVVTSSECRKSDEWCFVYKKFEVSYEHYIKLTSRLGSVKGDGYPVVYDLRCGDGELVEGWEPGPGPPIEQIESGLLFEKMFPKSADYPDSYIASVYREGFAYFNFQGFKDDLLTHLRSQGEGVRKEKVSGEKSGK